MGFIELTFNTHKGLLSPKINEKCEFLKPIHAVH